METGQDQEKEENRLKSMSTYFVFLISSHRRDVHLLMFNTFTIFVSLRAVIFFSGGSCYDTAILPAHPHRIPHRHICILG